MTKRQQAVEFFVSMNWTGEQASGIVANLEAESNLNPSASGDSGTAWGIAQWRGERQANFEALFGKPIQQSSFEEQLAFVHAELQRAEKRAGDALAACTTAAEAADTICRLYERPKYPDKDSAIRMALAERILQDYGSGVGANAAETPRESLPPQQPATPVPAATPPPPEFAMPAILAQLLPMVLGMFTPGGRQQVTPVTNLPADQLTPFLLSLFSMIGQKTGVLPPGEKITTDEQAVAAVAELTKQKATNAELVAQIERHAVNFLSDLAPVFDKLIAVDKAENEARIAGRQSASSVAIEEHKAGLWDMTRTLVTSLLIMLWGIAWGLLGAIIGMAFKEKPDPTLLAALIGLAGPIWTGAIVATVAAIVAYRFDGSAATNAARAISGQIDIASKRVR